MRSRQRVLVGLGCLMGLILSLVASRILSPVQPVQSVHAESGAVVQNGSAGATGANSIASFDDGSSNRSHQPAVPELISEKPSATPPATPPAASPVRAIAQQVTVRVITSPVAGSGVLLGQRANTYLVLTCDHVVAEGRGRYSILTSDGKTHAAHRLSVPALNGLDLALLTFQSETSYRAVALGDSDALPSGAIVHAAGFPNYRFYREQNSLASTAAWGVRAYQFTRGQYRMSLDNPLPGGYRLGYTNEVEQGMSGGPVLDEQGRLVGINGRLKYPIQGIDAYTFADGTRPSQTLFQQLEALSWAIPISSFRPTLDQVLASQL